MNQIIRDRLPNNYAGAGYDGIVYVPNTTGGCDAFINGGAQGSNCLDYGPDTGNSTNDASWSGGIPPAGSVNPNWQAARISLLPRLTA